MGGGRSAQGFHPEGWGPGLCGSSEWGRCSAEPGRHSAETPWGQGSGSAGQGVGFGREHWRPCG